MIRVAAGIIAGVWLTTFALNHFRLNLTPSAPIGLYRIVHEPVVRGSLVLLRDPMKTIVGWPGDTVRLTPEGTYINGKLIADSAVPENSPYPPYPYQTIQLERDMYWVINQHPASYDSRYTGAVPGVLIGARVQHMDSTMIETWLALIGIALIGIGVGLLLRSFHTHR